MADFRPKRANFGSERADLGPERGLGGGRTYGRTDVRTYGRTDGRLEIHPCVLQDIGPLGPLPKKGMNRLTDLTTNQPTD